MGLLKITLRLGLIIWYVASSEDLQITYQDKSEHNEQKADLKKPNIWSFGANVAQFEGNFDNPDNHLPW